MEHSVQCCIAGGGPAGMMLGVLLARVGVSVVVIEKHKDFLRDFRGDTIHPSTLEVLHELGWLADVLRLPHQKVPDLTAQFGTVRLKLADFSRLSVRAPYIAMMPQWDFLNFLSQKGIAYPGFKLMMETEALELVIEGGAITGVRAKGSKGPITIKANLVVAADGRASTLRAAAGFSAEQFGAPMDALWFRLPRMPSDTDQTQGRIDAGRIFVMLNRGDYWQCAFVIPKGGDAGVRAAGLEAFRASIAPLLPFDVSRANAIQSLGDVKLLVVQVDRLKTWARPGFLCIGDAAHAMSPVGGVGINLAIQDAVAAANVLALPLRENRLTYPDLKRVQARRDFPTRMSQRLQLAMQNTVIAPALAAKGSVTPPLALRILTRTPFLNRLPARLLGLGFRPEHVAPYIRDAQG